jgi:hypothetical protein
MVERAPQRRRDRAGPGADLEHAPLAVVPHHHPAGVARQAPEHFRGNVRAVLARAVSAAMSISGLE